MGPGPSLRLVDTHCHLNFDEFEQDRQQVIERSRAAGVCKILIPGIDLETSRSAIKLALDYPEIYAAVGVHPNSGIEWTNNTLSNLKQLAAEKKVVAIGEIGLDYYRTFTLKGLQRQIFMAQLELAAELGLPVIIHNRQATDDILEILTAWHQSLIGHGSKLADHPGVLHSFSANVDAAKSLCKMNFKLGITGPVTYRNSTVMQSVVISLPLEDLLIETDAPYLTPHPFRGKRNEPANVRIVAEKVSEIKNYPMETVANTTSITAEQLFDWSEIH